MPREVISIGSMLTIMGTILTSTVYLHSKFDAVLERIAAVDKAAAAQAVAVAELAKANALQDAQMDTMNKGLSLIGFRQSFLYGKLLGRTDITWPAQEEPK